MRKFGIFFLAAGALSLGACSETTTDEEVNEEVEVLTYNLDNENSSLKWAAQMSPDYGHKGTIDFESGSITMENGELKEGSFIVDLKSIKVTDLGEEKAPVLEGHLKGTMVDEDHPQDMFFNTPENATAEVKVGEYKDGKLTTTLILLGTEVTQDVPVEITSDENGATIKGKFKFNFAAFNMPGLEPSEHGAIQPDFDFDLNVVLTK